MAFCGSYNYSRAVANGPVGPAMAGPIIAVVIFFLIKKKLIYFFGRTNNRGSFFRFFSLNTKSP